MAKAYELYPAQYWCKYDFFFRYLNILYKKNERASQQSHTMCTSDIAPTIGYQVYNYAHSLVKFK